MNIYIYIHKKEYICICVRICIYVLVRNTLCIYIYIYTFPFGILYKYILRQLTFDDSTPFGGSMHLTMHACAHTAWLYCSVSAFG